MNNNRRNQWIIIWLVSGCFLIFVMLIIGGITRLTGSGLSIVEWNLISGTVPPLNNIEWNSAFEKYKQFPEYMKLNYGMSLQEFKYIFFWEYLHRFIGRFISIVFVVPFILFYIKGMFEKALIKRLFLIFILGGLQGFVGWFMVKSGLVDNPHVSQYRLAAHLLLALGLMSLICLTTLQQMNLKPVIVKRSVLYVSVAITILIIIQIFFGALTAGLKAGYAYNTFPDMNGEYIPEGVLSHIPTWINVFDNGITVQFIHRILAMLLVLLGIIFWFISRNCESRIRQMSYLILIVILIQFTFGVITLVYHVPLIMGVLHQAMAALLLMTSVIITYRIWP